MVILTYRLCTIYKFTGDTIQILKNGKLSDEIHVEEGISHGDSVSPLLFKSIMDEIIKVKTKERILGGNKEIRISYYAYNDMLFVDSENNEQ